MGTELDQKLRALKRQEQALELRRAGASNRQIGDALGISGEAARKLVKRALLKRINRFAEVQEEVKALELERLDEMLVRLWRRAAPNTLTCANGHEGRSDPCEVCSIRTFPTPPDQSAVDRILKIMDRRAKFLGLDAPQRVEILTLDDIDHQIRLLQQQMDEQGIDLS